MRLGSVKKCDRGKSVKTWIGNATDTYHYLLRSASLSLICFQILKQTKPHLIFTTKRRRLQPPESEYINACVCVCVCARVRARGGGGGGGGEGEERNEEVILIYENSMHYTTAYSAL